MQRHRQIAAAPKRLPSESWQTIAELLADTLDRSPHVSRGEVESCMQTAAPVGRMLIAGGHLEERPLVLVADSVHLSINTVSGTDALGLSENLNPVPGGAGATEWTIHLPAAEPLTAAVTAIAATSSRLSAADPPASQTASLRESMLDEEALRAWIEDA